MFRQDLMFSTIWFKKMTDISQWISNIHGKIRLEWSLSQGWIMI